MGKKKQKSQMRPRTYRVLELAVEDGVKYGYQRAHKHVDNPSEQAIIEEIQASVLSSISEWFLFDDDEGL